MLRMLLVSLLAIAAGVLGFLVARPAQSPPAALVGSTSPSRDPIGSVAPPLVLSDLDGKTIDLAAFSGRSIMLNFWASWCGPCIEEMPLLDAINRDARLGNPIVIGIALDEETAVRRFLAEHPVRYAIAIGFNGVPDTSVAFGNNRDVLPYSVLIDASGVIRKTRFGSFTATDLQEWVKP